MASGSTPQEHNGNGTPNSVAFTTDQRAFFSKMVEHETAGNQYMQHSGQQHSEKQIRGHQKKGGLYREIDSCDDFHV
jgi:hypothetical protein